MRISSALLIIWLLALRAQAAGKPLPAKADLETAKQLVTETFAKELSESDKTPAIKAMLELAEKTAG